MKTGIECGTRRIDPLQASRLQLLPELSVDQNHCLVNRPVWCLDLVSRDQAVQIVQHLQQTDCQASLGSVRQLLALLCRSLSEVVEVGS